MRPIAAAVWLWRWSAALGEVAVSETSIVRRRRTWGGAPREREGSGMEEGRRELALAGCCTTVEALVDAGGVSRGAAGARPPRH